LFGEAQVRSNILRAPSELTSKSSLEFAISKFVSKTLVKITPRIPFELHSTLAACSCARIFSRCMDYVTWQPPLLQEHAHKPPYKALYMRVCVRSYIHILMPRPQTNTWPSPNNSLHGHVLNAQHHTNALYMYEYTCICTYQCPNCKYRSTTPSWPAPRKAHDTGPSSGRAQQLPLPYLVRTLYAEAAAAGMAPPFTHGTRASASQELRHLLPQEAGHPNAVRSRVRTTLRPSPAPRAQLRPAPLHAKVANR
jgi:hypothetical protein